MQHKTRTVLLVCAALTTQLMTAGCLFGGGSILGGLGEAFASFFGGSNNDDNGSSGNNENIVNNPQVTPPGNNDDFIPDGGSGSGNTPQVAVLHNPEPGSLMLFGSGLAGLTLIRRRKSRKNS